MTSGMGRWASRNVWRVSRSGSAGPEVATMAATRPSAAPARIAPMAPIEWPTTAPIGDLRPGEQGVERRQRVEAELAGADGQRLGRVRAVAADVDGQAVEARGVQEDRVGQGPVAGRLPAVDQGHARAALAAAGRDEPGRQLDVAGAHGRRLVGQPEVGRRHRRHVLARVAGALAIDEREAVGQPERGGRQCGQHPGASDESHDPRGMHDRSTCQAGGPARAVAVSPGRRPG